MKKKRVRNALILSLLLHAVVSIFLLRLERKDRPLNKALDITIIDTQELEKKMNQLTEEQKRQIVDQSEKAANEDIAEDAKYLSRNNQKVAEETKAEQHGHFNNNVGQGLVEKGKQHPQEPVPEKKKASIAKAKNNLGEKRQDVAPWEVVDQKTKTGLPTLEALKPKFDWNKVAGANPNRPSAENPGTQAATDDYLKDVKTGAQTLLSTREFVYFTYYNRIKNQLQQYWEPKIKDKVTQLFRQGRQIASNQDRLTKVRITLDRKGTLVGVAVLGESGVRELDDAAIEAFRAAAPFPNPPAGIVEGDGTIKIDWSFILEAQATAPVRFQARRGPDVF